MSIYVEGTGRGARQKASEVLSECINDDEHFIIYFYAFLRFEARVPWIYNYGCHYPPVYSLEHIYLTNLVHTKKDKGKDYIK